MDRQPPAVGAFARKLLTARKPMVMSSISDDAIRPASGLIDWLLGGRSTKRGSQWLCRRPKSVAPLAHLRGGTFASAATLAISPRRA